MTWRKNSYLFRRPVAGGLLVVFVAALTGCSTIRKHPDFDQRSAEIGTVSVVRPEVTIELMVFKGDNKPLFEESRAATESAFGAIGKVLSAKGYEVKPLVITDEMLGENPELGFQLSRLKDRYASLVKDVQEQYVKKSKWDNFRLSLGSDVNQFADLVGADALVFSTATGFTKSGGEIARDVAKSMLIAAASLGSLIVVYGTSGGQIHLSVVDGDSGDLLWHNFTDPNRTYNLTKSNELEAMVKQVLKAYPRRQAPERKPILESEIPVPEEVQFEGRRKRINVPVETVKLTTKAGLAAGETTLKVTGQVVKGVAAPLTSLDEKKSKRVQAQLAYEKRKQEAMERRLQNQVTGVT